MTEAQLQALTVHYNGYVDTYRGADGALPRMMQLKRIHTGFVVKNAGTIVEGERFDANSAIVAKAAALLHDTGRYEQLKIYNTFSDAQSVNHAQFSHDIVKSNRWLEEIGLGEVERNAILTAVLVHNRRDIDEASMDALTLGASKVVRDADKLDIFRVLETELTTTDWHKDMRAFWNLPIKAAPNERVTEAILAHRPVDYKDIKSFPDFILIQVGWMISGLYYGTSRKLCRERGYLEFRRRFLHELTDSAMIDELCDHARAALENS